MLLFSRDPESKIALGKSFTFKSLELKYKLLLLISYFSLNHGFIILFKLPSESMRRDERFREDISHKKLMAVAEVTEAPKILHNQVTPIPA